MYKICVDVECLPRIAPQVIKVHDDGRLLDAAGGRDPQAALSFMSHFVMYPELFWAGIGSFVDGRRIKVCLLLGCRE